MNKDLAGLSAVWRALLGCGVAAFIACLHGCQRAAEDGFTADAGSVAGDGCSFRCCTVGGFSHDCGSLSVVTVQQKCDEKERVRAHGARKGSCRRVCGTP